MIRLTSTIVAGAFLLISGCAAEDGPTPAERVESILGGQNISSGQFPTVVGVRIGRGGLCTGTLVAPDIVLTAAHCISPGVIGISQAQITAATTVIFDATNLQGQGKTVGATSTAPHPAFTQPGRPDIGIIRLDQRMTDRTPTPINTDATKAPIGLDVTMIGYGIADDGDAEIGNWLESKVSTACLPYQVSDADFLCFNQQNGTGKCSGDSGGPSFATIDGVEALVGITSFGDENCQFFGADYRTDAASARDFLETNAPELYCIDDGLCDPACGSDGRDPDPDCGPECVADADCGDGNVCTVNGDCEPEPFSPGGLGAECGEGQTACASDVCATGGDGSFCSQECSDGAGCPSGFDCLQAEGTGVCWAAEDSGCSVAGDSSRAMWLLLAFGVLVYGRRRRRG